MEVLIITRDLAPWVRMVCPAGFPTSKVQKRSYTHYHIDTGFVVYDVKSAFNDLPRNVRYDKIIVDYPITSEERLFLSYHLNTNIVELTAKAKKGE